MRVVCVSDKAYLAFDDEGNPRPVAKRDRLRVSLTIGKTYEVVGERLGMYAIIDDTGGRYLYPKDRFHTLDE